VTRGQNASFVVRVGAEWGDEFETEFDCHAGMWRIADAHNATLACVGTAVLVTCAAILAQLDYGAVMGRYSGYI
jgi:hypothetical protein